MRRSPLLIFTAGLGQNEKSGKLRWQSVSYETRYVSSLSRMSLQQKFEEAAEAVKSLTKRPTDEELLELYALFKQATAGDVNTSRPGMFDMKGRAKWDFWEKKKGMSKNDAMEKYVNYVNNLLAKYS